MDPSTASDAIAAVRDQIDDLDEDTMNCLSGIHGSVRQITKALVDLDLHLDERQFQQASDLGAGVVVSGFIALQRLLGELTSLGCRKTLIVEDLTKKLMCNPEEILPLVDALLASAEPSPPAMYMDPGEHALIQQRILAPKPPALPWLALVRTED